MSPRSLRVCVCGHQLDEGWESWIFGTMAQLIEAGCVLKVIAISRSGYALCILSPEILTNHITHSCHHKSSLSWGLTILTMMDCIL